MADAGLRRSEAAALLWGDIAAGPDGFGRLTIRRSKTDQTGEGRIVAVTPAAMDDLDCLARFGGRLPERRVWPVSDRTISRRIDQAARDAGLGDEYSGHSGRVGMAIRMTRAGVPIATVMRQCVEDRRNGRLVHPQTKVLARRSGIFSCGRPLPVRASCYDGRADAARAVRADRPP